MSKNKREAGVGEKVENEKDEKNSAQSPRENQPESKNQNEIEQLYKNDPTKFIPKLYNFKLPKETNIGEIALANSPPFWVLVDHLIGVVWKLYSNQNDGRKLGIMQMQWALEFIKMIKDDRGNLTKTLEEVKNTIEDALILKYASLPREVKKKDEDLVASDGKQPSSFHFNVGPSQNASISLRDVMSRTPKNIEQTVRSKPTGLPLDGSFEVYRSKDKAQAKQLPPPADITMKMEDIQKYLLYLKKEQHQRVLKEQRELEKIDNAISQVETGQFDIESWLKNSDGEKSKNEETEAKEKQSKDADDIKN